MRNYFITVIVPIYNAELYIERAVKSLLNQTTNEIEIILVDDGSKDNSGKICDKYKQIENVKVIHKENGGACTARNIGLASASGKYVSFVDSDDFMDVDAYKKIIDILKYNDADILDFGWKYISETGEKTENFHKNPKNKLLNKKYIKTQILPPLLNLLENRANFVFDFAWNKIYKKEIIDQHQIKFDERRNTWEDRIFVVEFLKYCENYYCMDECFYNYVSVQESLSRRYNAQYLELILKNYNLYVQLFGEEYNFSSQYVINYWSNSIENMIIQQLKVKDQHREVIENITNILKEPQVKYWFKNRDKKDKKINEYLKENQYDRIIEIYEKRLLNIQKNEKKVVRKQRLKAFVRRLIKE